MNEEHRQKLLDLFIHIRDNGPIDGSEGICCEVWRKFGYTNPVSLSFDDWSLVVFREWPEGKGSGVSPIHNFFGKEYSKEYNWDKSHMTGQKRYRLLDYLIKRLEEGN